MRAKRATFILKSGQTFIRMPKIVNFGGQTVLPDRSVLIGQKLAKNAKMGKIQMQYFELFSNILHRTFMSFGNHFCSTFFVLYNSSWEMNF